MTEEQLFKSLFFNKFDSWNRSQSEHELTMPDENVLRSSIAQLSRGMK